MKKISIGFAFLFVILQVQAQNLDSEIGYLYTKAKYLLETDRSSEASELLTQIIKEDAHYEEAMALRADARYRMGNNKKARKDILRFIEQNGLTPNAVKTLALINYTDKDYDAAANSLYTASLLFPRDVELLEKRAEVLLNSGQQSEACVAWHDAAKLGSKSAKSQISKNCYGDPSNLDPLEDKRPKNTPRIEIDNPESSQDEDPTQKDNKVEPKESTDDDKNDDDIDIVEEEKETVEEEVYDITDIDLKEGKDKWLKLDEELSVNILGGGLGDRKIKRMPNILLLTDEKGTIVIDLCVGKAGEVLAAKYNPTVSTMHHRNNEEYLLRKTKDLEFGSHSKAKCGRIIYNINM